VAQAHALRPLHAPKVSRAHRRLVPSTEGLVSREPDCNEFSAADPLRTLAAEGRADLPPHLRPSPRFDRRTPHPRAYPAGDASPRPLPLAGRCAVAPPRLRFVPLAPLTIVDAGELAARYRRLGIEAREEAPLEGVERFRDLRRGQLAAEDLVDTARTERAAPGTNELVVVVTDADLYIRGNAWRYAFAYADGRVAVVSLARMDPAFPWVSPQPYAPRRPACDVELRARAFKMITRQLVLTTCGLPRTSAPHSVRGAQVLSLADLDAIDETEL
jgi:hypothetical protein